MDVPQDELHEHGRNPADGRFDRRRAETDAKLRYFVEKQLEDFGYGRFTIERLAKDSGVAKTTIYRRWASKPELVFDLVVGSVGSGSTLDTGSMAGDISALVDRAVRLFMSQTGKQIFPGLIADMSIDTDLQTRLLVEFVQPARSEIREIFERARTRGEIDHEVDLDTFHATLLGVLFARTYLFAADDEDVVGEQLRRQLFAQVFTGQ